MAPSNHLKERSPLPPPGPSFSPRLSAPPLSLPVSLLHPSTFSSPTTPSFLPPCPPPAIENLDFGIYSKSASSTSTKPCPESPPPEEGGWEASECWSVPSDDILTRLNETFLGVSEDQVSAARRFRFDMGFRCSLCLSSLLEDLHALFCSTSLRHERS